MNMAVASGPAGPVLAGPVFAMYFESARAQNYKSALFMACIPRALASLAESRLLALRKRCN